MEQIPKSFIIIARWVFAESVLGKRKKKCIQKVCVCESVHFQLPQCCVAVAAQVSDPEVVHHHQDKVGPAALLRRRRDVLQKQERQQNTTRRPHGLHEEEITAEAVGVNDNSRMSKVQVIRTRSAYITTQLLHILCCVHLHILYFTFSYTNIWVAHLYIT